MGYESKLFIVNKPNYFHREIEGKEMFFAEEIARYELFVCYPISEKMRKYPETDCYIYADDGNTEIVYDLYDNRLTEVPIDDAIKIVEEAMAYDDYRRLPPLLALLKSFNKEDWNKLVVLHYGC